MGVLETALGLILLFWCAVGAVNLWSYRGLTTLRDDQAAEPSGSNPKISIIVAARNEEESLPVALESLLELDYPDYEVIVVDDDSTDRTGAIAEDWAKRPESGGRLKVIHNHELPPGWTGKVHALNLAAKTASGEWILATDADVVFHPTLLRLALDRALSEGVQLLSLVPEFELASFADKVVLPAFSLLLSTLYPLRLVNHPKFPRALAVGAFILMRRKALEALGGYERLRKTVIEDVRMAELFKRHGRRVHVAMTHSLFRTRAYGSWRALWEGLSRSAFEGAGFSVPKVLVSVAAGNAMVVLPAVVVVVRLLWDAHSGQSLWSDLTLALSVTAYVIGCLVAMPFVLHLRGSPLSALLLPLGSIFYSAVSLNSAWKSIVGGGVRWKGRHYHAA